MPRITSTSRSEVRRRDRHKVYAIADPRQQDEVNGNGNSPPESSKESLPRSSSPGAAFSRNESGGCSASELPRGDHVGVRADDRGGCHVATVPPTTAPPPPTGVGVGAVSTLGGVGPGSEPPVAVASHAFAQEPTSEALSDHSPHVNHGTEGTEVAPLGRSLLGGQGLGVVSPGGYSGACRSFDRVDASERNSSGNDDSADSRAESTNEDEAETLPDSFNLSDEFGPEGASTGRNYHDDEGCGDRHKSKCGDSVFSGLSGGSSRSRREKRRGRPVPGRFSRARHSDDDDTWSRCESRQEYCEAASASASENSDWASSSGERRRSHTEMPPPRQVLIGRRTRRSSRIMPSGNAGETSVADSEGIRRRLRASRRKDSRYRSPPSRWHSRGAEEKGHHSRRRRGGGRHKNRDSRRVALMDTESMSGEANYGAKAEVERLKRENEALKQHRERERHTRKSNDTFTRHDADHRLSPRGLSRSSSLRRDHTLHSTRHRELSACEHRGSGARARRYLSRSPTPVFHPPDVDESSVRSSPGRRRRGSTRRAAPAASWQEFVSKSNSPTCSIGQAAWRVQQLELARGGFDISLPRVLVEGGFLWKIPYHNAGTPKRRWFQMKPAEGLLTTASGRLVVRPTIAVGGGNGGSGGGEWDGGNPFSERSGDGGGGVDVAASMQMARLRAAWPLSFLWVDPEKDLKRSPPREIGIEEIVDLARGHKTPAFWQQAAHRGIHTLPDPKLCFSLVGSDRTLDLAAESLSEAKEWVRALARVILMVQRGGVATAIGDGHASSSRFQLEPAYPDPEETGIAETVEDDAETISQERVPRRQSDGGATAASRHHGGEPSCQNVPAAHHYSDADFVPKKTDDALGGGGGSWSPETIRAWRRRLFPAVTRGDVAAVLALFDQGCPVDLVQTGTGDTPMLLACRLGDVEMTRLCLGRGSRNDPHPDFGQTALHAAVASGQEACARLLLETAAPSRSDAVVSNHKDPNRETPLHVACRRGYDGIVEALLHHGADLRAVDRKGNTPLHGAAGGGRAGALASLLDAGGDCILEERNAQGERALHAAAAAGHIACVELLLGTAAEPDIPNEDGHTPFALASRGGHLAVTRLIRQYAPEAGTPSGGDARFQAHRRRRAGGGAAGADALPRPHGSTSNGPGTPSHRSRDLEHRLYSAAGLDPRHFEPSDESPEDRECHRSGGIVSNAGEPYPAENNSSFAGDGRIQSPSSSSSAPVHGSLFDGLQVYVVGGRQPLGSQHASVAATAGRTPQSTAHLSARTMVLDSHRLSTSPYHLHQQHQEPWEQQSSYSPASRHDSVPFASTASFSSGLEANWRENVLSAPTAVAPSPPLLIPNNDGGSGGGSTTVLNARAATGTPTGGDRAGRVGAPGSARALARMIHFSYGDPSARPFGDDFRSEATTAVVASLSVPTPGTSNIAVEAASPGATSKAPEGGASSTGTPTEGIGSWMTPSNRDQGIPGAGSDASTPKPGGPSYEDNSEAMLPQRSSVVDDIALSGDSFGHDIAEASGTTGSTGIEEKLTENEVERFILNRSEEQPGRQGEGGESEPPTGLWRVFLSQGYPYYLHEASGHSQWGDPRERENVCPQAQLTSAASDGSAGLGGRFEVNEEAALWDSRAEKAGFDGEPPPPASPIKPTGVQVAVKVSRFGDPVGAPQGCTVETDSLGSAAVVSGGKGDEGGSNISIYHNLEGNSRRANPVGAKTGPADSYGSADCSGFGSVGTTGFEDGISSVESESEASLLGTNNSIRSNHVDVDCHQNTGKTTAGKVLQRYTAAERDGNARCDDKVKNSSYVTTGQPWQYGFESTGSSSTTESAAEDASVISGEGSGSNTRDANCVRNSREQHEEERQEKEKEEEE